MVKFTSLRPQQDIRWMHGGTKLDGWLDRVEVERESLDETMLRLVFI